MKKSLLILLVEDDKVDQINVKRAIKHINPESSLIIKQNGVEALEYLNNDENQRPAIIILDLNMPKMNGIEFLKRIKNHPTCKMIPIVVMTTSAQEQDRLECFEYNVSGYMVKPLHYADFLEVLSVVYKYWLLSEKAPVNQINITNQPKS